jgi:hypothetical protein
MWRPALAVSLLCLSLLPAASAGKDRPARRPEPVVTAAPAPSSPMAPPLFDGTLPLDHGRLPDGLANPSAQGCHACHDLPFDTWQSSPHARGPSAAMRLAAAESGDGAACLSCHLPLRAQQGERLLGVELPGPWDATLASEGVTCAACHLRRGAVVGPTPQINAPHSSAWRDDLGSAETCAACHQLTWPGAATPLYDTFGEWSRSPWARAGVSCTTCHMGAQGHTMRADRERALSALLSLGGAEVVRGGPPVKVELTLQNTGAGHSVPTGSPWIGWRVEIVLLREKGPALVLSQHELVRRVATTAPWQTESDSRLAPAETRTVSASLSLPQDAPPGDGALVVRVQELVRGAATEPPFELVRVPVRVR